MPRRDKLKRISSYLLLALPHPPLLHCVALFGLMYVSVQHESRLLEKVRDMYQQFTEEIKGVSDVRREGREEGCRAGVKQELRRGNGARIGIC
jgi:hypothetical protein